MRRVTDRSSQRGVTLVEMIVSIVVAGILLALVGMFGRWQIQSYFDISSRVELTDAGDTALRRMAREIQSALPNSVRVNVANGGNLLEFVPITDAGRYRADVKLDTTGNPLDFLSATDTSFDVLGPTVTIGANQRLVIYNLGLSGSDVYAGTSSRVPTTTGTALSSVGFAGAQFPFASPANRFQIVGTPVTFECDAAVGHVMRRYWNYGFMASQPATAAGLSGLSSTLVANVSACDFEYTPGAIQRNGLLVIRLTLTANGESVDLLHQVEVLNSP